MPPAGADCCFSGRMKSLLVVAPTASAAARHRQAGGGEDQPRPCKLRPVCCHPIASPLQQDIGKRVEEKINRDQRRYFLMEQVGGFLQKKYFST